MQTAAQLHPEEANSGTDELSSGASLECVRRYLDESGFGAKSGRKGVVKFPATFSLIDDPESALNVLGEIAGLIVGGAKDLRYDQTNCTQVDICAESVSAAFAKQAAAAGVHVDGDYPESDDALASVAAFGGPAVLKGFTPVPTPEIAVLPLEMAFSSGIAHRKLDWERTAFRAEKVPLLLNNRLGKYELKREFFQRFASFLGDVIDNAYEHGSNEWWIACSFRKLKDSGVAPGGRCQIVVFNLGETIAQTVADGLDALARADCETILEHHEERGHFNANWTRSSAWTLLALQHGMSRFVGVERGAGTTEMIRFFEYLTQSASIEARPRMAIVSGDTHILLDGRYRLRPNPSRNGKYDMAFNEPNDLRYPPNPAVIRTLSRRFPGALVTIHFHLHPTFLQPVTDHGDELAPKGGGG